MKVSELFANPFYYARELKPNEKENRIDVKYFICRSKIGMENFIKDKKKVQPNHIIEVASGDDEAVLYIDMTTGTLIPYEGAPHKDKTFIAEDYGKEDNKK